MTRALFDDLIVSRETFNALENFHDLVVKWSSRINLVSKSDLSALWERHILDSAQVVRLCREAKIWVDIGSGGGFPAIVLSVLSRELAPEREIIMIESDQRKATFLRSAIRELELSARVISRRAEDVEPLEADVVSARALAPLTTLLGFAQRHLKPQGTAVFLKGETWEKEVQKASESWSFRVNHHKSKTSPKAAILEIEDIERV